MNDFLASLDTPGAQSTLLLSGIVFLGSLLVLVPLMSVRGRSRKLEENPENSGTNLLGPAFAPPPPLSKLGAELRQAGYYHPDALARFNTLRVFLILVPLLVAGAIASMANRMHWPQIAMAGVIGGALGFSLPRVFINMQARSRVRAIEKALPVFADLMSLALLSGQNLLGGLLRVRSEMRFSNPVFTDELDLIARQAEINNFTAAIDQFAERVAMPDVTNLALILSQSQHLGTDVATGLLEYATVMRTTLKHRAEAQAQRAGFWMMFPTIFCLWLPAAAVLLAPAYFEFQDRRQQNREILLEGKENYKERFGPYMKSPKLPMPNQNNSKTKPDDLGF